MCSIVSLYSLMYSVSVIAPYLQMKPWEIETSMTNWLFFNWLLKFLGWEPVHYVAMEQPVNFGSSGDFVMQSWVGSSANEILRREPYLVVSLLFLCLIGFIYIFPKVLLHLKFLWVSYGPHLNLEIFGETSQILGRVLLMIDLKRIWTKLKLCKTSNFLRGAKNARVWASSLASVSLGKTTLCRSSS